MWMSRRPDGLWEMSAADEAAGREGGAVPPLHARPLDDPRRTSLSVAVGRRAESRLEWSFAKGAHRRGHGVVAAVVAFVEWR